MRLLRSIARTSFCLLATTSCWALSNAPVSWAGELSPEDLIEEVTEIVDRDFLNLASSSRVTTYQQTAIQEELAQERRRTATIWNQQRRQLLSRSYDNTETAYEAIATALETLNDPYTYFVDPDQFEHLRQTSAGEVASIGLKLAMENALFPRVNAPPALESPAFLAGIRIGDAILAIDGHSTANLTLTDIIDELADSDNGQVTLRIQRRGRVPFEVAVVPEQLELPTLAYEVRERGNQRWAYIRLTRFNDVAEEAMRDAITQLEEAEVEGYILDLRSNPGGLLEAGTAIADMFLDDGTIVTLEDRNRLRRIIDRTPALTDSPLTVLVDSASASSSEILTAALQDSGRATIVGATTYGKGVVQMMHILPDGSCLTVTNARYFTPNGDNIHNRGLTPDIPIRLTDTDVARFAEDREAIATFADPQYAAAVEALFPSPSR